MSEDDDLYLQHQKQSEKEMKKWAIAVALFLLFSLVFMLSQ